MFMLLLKYIVYLYFTYFSLNISVIALDLIQFPSVYNFLFNCIIHCRIQFIKKLQNLKCEHELFVQCLKLNRINSNHKFVNLFLKHKHVIQHLFNSSLYIHRYHYGYYYYKTLFSPNRMFRFLHPILFPFPVCVCVCVCIYTSRLFSYYLYYDQLFTYIHILV